MIGHGQSGPLYLQLQPEYFSKNDSFLLGAWLDLKTTELHLGIHFHFAVLKSTLYKYIEVIVTEFAGLCIYV